MYCFLFLLFLNVYCLNMLFYYLEFHYFTQACMQIKITRGTLSHLCSDRAGFCQHTTLYTWTVVHVLFFCFTYFSLYIVWIWCFINFFPLLYSDIYTNNNNLKNIVSSNSDIADFDNSNVLFILSGFVFTEIL